MENKEILNNIIFQELKVLQLMEEQSKIIEDTLRLLEKYKNGELN